MHRTIRILAFTCVAAAILAGCSSSKKAQAPLSLVPADTPYLVANLAPVDKKVRQALLEVADRNRMVQVRQLEHLGARLEDSHRQHLAKLARYTATYLGQHSWNDILADSGVDPDGLFAFYGLGLSPVMRGQLQDAGKFQKWIGGFEAAYGQPFTKAKTGDVDYQYLVLGQSNLRLVVATHAGQFVVALLPASGDKRLRLALGVDQPGTTAKAREVVQKLAKANGYKPYAISEVNLAQLPALIAGGKDPMLATAFAKPLRTDNGKTTTLAQLLPASCRKDLERITARVPLISAGYTRAQSRDFVQQTDIQLAPDITSALDGMGATVPGLGARSSDALFDMSVALPVSKLGQFWMGQAHAVTSNPFHCPALQSINKLAARLERVLPRLGMPPLHDLLGLRVVVDSAGDANGASALHALQARVLIATNDASGLVALAKAMLPPLAQVPVKPDGKPVAVPESVRHQFNIPQPMWVASRDKALAIGAGSGEGAKLTPMLDASKGAAGDIVQAHIDGAVYTRWLAFARGHVAHGNGKDADEMNDTFDALAKAMSHIDAVNVHAQLTPNGLRIQTEKQFK